MTIANPGPLVICLESNTGMNCLTDTLSASQPIAVIEREVYAAIQSGDRGLICRLDERVEPARLLGRDQTVIGVRRVCEALDPKHISKDACGCA